MPNKITLCWQSQLIFHLFINFIHPKLTHYKLHARHYQKQSFHSFILKMELIFFYFRKICSSWCLARLCATHMIPFSCHISNIAFIYLLYSFFSCCLCTFIHKKWILCSNQGENNLAWNFSVIFGQLRKFYAAFV